MSRPGYDHWRRHTARRAARASAARWRATAAAIALTGALFACGESRDKGDAASAGRGAAESMPAAARVVADTGAVAYDAGSAEFPRILFGDGQLSLNDRCIVRQVKLNLRMPPIYVNGQPIGFC